MCCNSKGARGAKEERTRREGETKVRTRTKEAGENAIKKRAEEREKKAAEKAKKAEELAKKRELRSRMRVATTSASVPKEKDKNNIKNF